MKGRRTVGRLFAGLALAGLLLAGGEAAARRWGDAPATFPSPLPFQEMQGESLKRVPGGILWPWGRARVAPSPARGLRVQLYGESAAFGDGLTGWASMGGVMERGLRRTLSRPVDVLNFGLPGAGSRQLARILEQAVSTERPDVVVFFIGNNELHELRALKSVMPHYSARQELVRRRLWGSHLYRLATRALIAPPEPYVVDPGTWPTIDRLRTPADADDRALAMHFYARNIDRMMRAAEAAGVRVVVATVVVNEFHLLQLDLTRAQAALKEEALALRPTDRAGFVAKWRAAESLAERPLAALPETWEIGRRLAAEHGAKLCDVVDSASATSQDGLPPGAWFSDHCHPTAEGHRVIGDALAACVIEALGEDGPPRSGAAPTAPPGRLDGFLGSVLEPVTDDGSAESALRLGNYAMTRSQLADAAAAWDEAERRGADPGVLALNRALLALSRNDLPEARRQAATAHRLLADDIDVTGLAASLGVE
jgi:lysophospholipase L1-like esterase